MSSAKSPASSPASAIAIPKRCSHCTSTDGQCSARTWSCPTEAGGCGDSGPDCAGLPLSACRVGHGNNPPHVAMMMSAPRPGRDLYRFQIALEGRDVDVVCDGSRVFLLRGRVVGEDVTNRFHADEGVLALLEIQDAHAALVRADVIPWGEETAEETMRKADRAAKARRFSRAS